MTLADILATARVVASHPFNVAIDTPHAKAFALAILDLLAEAAPCGWEAPRVVTDRDDKPTLVMIGVPEQWTGLNVEPEDARQFARMLFAAADEADAKKETANG